MANTDEKQSKNKKPASEPAKTLPADSSNGSTPPALVRVTQESLRQRVIDTTSDLVRAELSGRDTSKLQGTLNHEIVLLRRQIIEKRERAEALLREAEADEYAADRSSNHLKAVEEERRSTAKEAI